MIEWSGDADRKFNVVWNTVGIPIIVSPVNNSIVIVVEWGLFFAPETTREQSLVNIENTVVIIIGIFCIWDTIVVIVHVVKRWFAKTLGHDSTVPNCLEEAVFVDVRIVTVIVIVNTVCTAEEVTIFLACVVVVIVVGIDFEVIPNSVVIIVDVIPVID